LIATGHEHHRHPSRSALHLRLLAANDPSVTHVLYRDNHVAP
jgi:hypothetical protein